MSRFSLATKHSSLSVLQASRTTSVRSMVVVARSSAPPSSLNSPPKTSPPIPPPSMSILPKATRFPSTSTSLPSADLLVPPRPFTVAIWLCLHSAVGSARFSAILVSRIVLMSHLFRVFARFLVVLCVALTASAFDNPLSDEAVREAYFLGQRHDASFLTNYIKFCPCPKPAPTSPPLLFSLHSPGSLSPPATTSATTAPSKLGSIILVRRRSSKSG